MNNYGLIVLCIALLGESSTYCQKKSRQQLRRRNRTCRVIDVEEPKNVVSETQQDTSIPQAVMEKTEMTAVEESEQPSEKLIEKKEVKKEVTTELKVQETLPVSPSDILSFVGRLTQNVNDKVGKFVREKADPDKLYALKTSIDKIFASMNDLFEKNKDFLKEEANIAATKEAFKKIVSMYLDWLESLGHGKTVPAEEFEDFCNSDLEYQNLQKLVKALQ